MSKQLQKISKIGLVPLVVLEDAACAKPLGEALAAGGIPIAEVTFRTDACLATIHAMKEIPSLIVGAGTVHTAEQAAAAVAAGATYIVTPAYNPSVIEYCIAHDVDVIPGTVTPGEIEGARAYGIRLCKFFPAAAYGGTTTLKALAGPFADVQFLPTGGVNNENMLDYLTLPNVAAVGGSFMTPDKLVAAHDWAGIAAVCRTAVQKVRDALPDR
ncbi:bifunctional 4-hydroxy-2-oxoglutarate aldolase/2-dehydro-3-deoxy-phosphogluconate aldolase [uncultured Selenomonas sp.]|uniref:bifunctional 4-hydroxy-2-oxoglutarate aldolase/2-dehydro-3-deoxy-phosphogluconate aldolase n=1 Tax=uncultured Selenomonas sp. TaxID=159275 RepID=UPI0028ECC550|nr:bifunctional 4-hydroxy-2-oxoglutarate aldolase/2-dehydro-3-deoxy-phosphogluconate aldolase [uncultured Selenomonas sp.]